MSTEDSIRDNEFRLETLRAYQMKQLDDLFATYKEIEEVKAKLERARIQHEEHHDLIDK